MSRRSNLPTLFNECKTISVNFLKKNGYLNPNCKTSGTIRWSRNGISTGTVGISIIMFGTPVLTLSYTCNNVAVEYSVMLLSLPSNLGKGEVWYFKCPRTGKLCRKLYLGKTYFLHRDAFKNCFYDSQVQSHRNRTLYKMYNMHFITERVYEQRFKKYFKTTYRGQPTKRLLKLQKDLELYYSVKGKLPSLEQLFVS